MRRALSPFIRTPLRRSRSADMMAPPTTINPSRASASMSRRSSAGRPRSVSQVERDAFNEGILLMQSPEFLKALAERTPSPRIDRRPVQREGRSRAPRSPLTGSEPKKRIKQFVIPEESPSSPTKVSTQPVQVAPPRFSKKGPKATQIQRPVQIEKRPIETVRTSVDVSLAGRSVLFGNDLSMQESTAVSMLRQAGGVGIKPEMEILKRSSRQADYIVTKDGVIRPQQLQTFLPYMSETTEVISELDFLDAFDGFLNSNMIEQAAVPEGEEREASIASLAQEQTPVVVEEAEEEAIAAVEDHPSPASSLDTMPPPKVREGSDWTPKWNVSSDMNSRTKVAASAPVSPEAQSLYQKLVNGRTPDSIERLGAVEHRKGLEELDDELEQMNLVVSNVKKKKTTQGKHVEVEAAEQPTLVEKLVTEASAEGARRSAEESQVMPPSSTVPIANEVSTSARHSSDAGPTPIVTDVSPRLNRNRHRVPAPLKPLERVHELVAPTIPNPQVALKKKMDLRVRKLRRFTMYAAPFPGDMIDRRNKLEDIQSSKLNTNHETLAMPEAFAAITEVDLPLPETNSFLDRESNEQRHALSAEPEPSPPSPLSVKASEVDGTITAKPKTSKTFDFDWDTLESFEDVPKEEPSQPLPVDSRSAVDLHGVYEDLLNLGGAELLETMSQNQQGTSEHSYQEAIRAAMPVNSVSGNGRRENGTVNQTVASAPWRRPSIPNPVNRTFAGDLIDMKNKTIGFTGVFSKALPADMIQQILRDSGSSSTNVVSPETSFVVYGTDPRGQVVNSAMKYDVPLVSERDFLASYAQGLLTTQSSAPAAQTVSRSPVIRAKPQPNHRLATTEDTIAQMEAQIRRLESKLRSPTPAMKPIPQMQGEQLKTATEPELEQKAFPERFSDKLSLRGKKLCFLENEEHELGLNPVTAVEWAVKAGAEVDYEYVPGRTNLAVSFSGLVPARLEGKIPRDLQIISIPKFIVASR